MFCNTMPVATLLFVVCFMVIFVSGVEETGVNEGCTWKDPETGKLYDISSLTRTVVGDEYVFNGDKGENFIYKANICGRVTSKCNADIPPGSTPVAFAYQKNKVFGDICIASLGDLMSAATWSTFRDKLGKKGFQVRYTGGSGGCPPPAPPARSVTYKFVCDSSARDKAILFNAVEDSSCQYTLEFKTAIACRSFRRFSATGFFFFLIFFSTCIYCFVEGSENMQKGATGVNIIPHYDSISLFFGLAVEGLSFTKELLINLYIKLTTGNAYGYTSIPQQADNTTSGKVKLPKNVKSTAKKYGSGNTNL
jgi:hypothetical protein